MIARLIACALLAAACARPAAPAPASALPTVPPMGSLFDSMMGGAPSATVFMLTKGELVAVTLLNHHPRYRLRVGSHAQVALSPDAPRLYVLSLGEEGGRLRSFDVLSGAEIASGHVAEPKNVVLSETGRGSMAFHPDGSRFLLLLLQNAGTRAWVGAYDPTSLGYVGVVAQKPGCADRLFASAGWVALVCLARGEVHFSRGDVRDDIAGRTQTISTGEPLWGATMLYDGTVIALPRTSTEGKVYRVSPKTQAIETVRSPSLAHQRVAPDGVAAVGLENIAVVTRDPARIHVIAATTSETLASHALPVDPGGSGVLAWEPFAYFTDGRAVYHVDLRNGYVEKMLGGLEGALVVALASQ